MALFLIPLNWSTQTAALSFAGVWVNAALAWGPIRAGGQRSPPGLHSCLRCLDHRAGHPAHCTHTFSAGSYRETAYSWVSVCCFIWVCCSLLLMLTETFLRSRENTDWMSTNFMFSCQLSSPLFHLCLQWCCRMHPSPAEPSHTKTYLQ